MLNAKSSRKKDLLLNELVIIEKNLQDSRKRSNLYNENKAIKSIKKNSKYFYSYAKKFSTVKHGIGPLKNNKGKYVYDNSKMSELISEQYTSVFNKTPDIVESSFDIFPENKQFELDDINLNDKMFLEAIKELKPNSSPGPDGMPSILLIKCKEIYAHVLRLLWQKCFDCETTPEILRQPEVVPLYKGGDKTKAKNYRPVSLTSHLIKVFEKVLKNIIVEHMERSEYFNPNQHGFRKGRSCLSELLEHYEDILNQLEKGNGVDVIYLDFAKAFDKVDFQILLHKLKNVGIGGKIGRWIYSFLYGRTQKVLVNGHKSHPSSVTSGVPQGSVLGPLLFLIMIGDIDANVAESSVRSFADDTRVAKEIKDLHSSTKLQSDTNSIYKWAEDNNMQFNEDKFEVLRYKTNKNIVQDTTSYHASDGSLIKESPSVRDLGVILSTDCTFQKHISETIQKMKNMSNWILRTFQTRDSVTLCTLWKTLVLPIHDYCSQLWSPHLIKYKAQFETVQYNFLKKIWSMSGKSYPTILKEMNLYSLERRRDRYRAIYVWKQIEGLVPSTGIKLNNSDRRGRLLNIMSLPTVKIPARNSSFNLFSIRLWNKLPRDIRGVTEVKINTFKAALDRYIKELEDNPHLPNQGPRRCSNDLPTVIDYTNQERRFMGRAPLSTKQ